MIKQRWIGSNWDLVYIQVPFALVRQLDLCVIIQAQMLGSNWDLVNCQVPFAFLHSSDQSTSFPISKFLQLAIA